MTQGLQESTIYQEMAIKMERIVQAIPKTMPGGVKLGLFTTV